MTLKSAVILVVLALMATPAAAELPPTFLLKWGAFGTGNGEFNYPFSVAADGAGNVYVADYQNHRIQKFDGSGTYLGQWGSFGSGDLQFNGPTGVTTDASGNVYVADSGNYRVAKFTPAGALLEMWGWGVATGAAALERCTGGCQRGISGHGDGQFEASYDLAVDAAGNVYVTSQGGLGYAHNSRIQKFAANGSYLTQWDVVGDTGILYAIGADPTGNIYATLFSSVEKYSNTGAHLLTVGTGPPSGSGDGQVRVPYGVTTDASGNVYVADTYNHRVQKFSSTGTYLTQWGTFGTGNGEFQYTNDVAAGPTGDIYVADYFNHRIQKFRPAVANAQPQIVAPATVSAPEGLPMPCIDATATDDDAGNTLTITYTSTPPLPSDLTFATSSPGLSPRNATIAGTPCCAGTYTITWTVNDGTGAANATNTTTTILTITPGPPPLCGAPPRLVAWWTFDDNIGGNPVRDIAGGNTGTIKGGTAVPGRVRCGALDVSGGPMTVTSTAGLNIGADFSVFSFTAWVRLHTPLARPKDRRYLAAKHVAGGNGYDFSLSPAGDNFMVRFFTPGTTPVTFGTTSCGLGNGWHHVAVVIRRGAVSCPSLPRDVTLYIDGALVGQAPLPILPSASLLNGQTLYIGAANPKCEADIDEVLIFQRALTQPDVTLLSNPNGFRGSCENGLCITRAGCPDAPQQMVAWWPFDEAAGKTTADIASATANNWNAVANVSNLRGAVRVSGKVGCGVGTGAMDMAGGPVRIDAPVPELNIRSEFSFTAWIRMHSSFVRTNSERHYLAVKHTTGLGYDFSLSPTGSDFKVNLYSPGVEPITFPITGCSLANGWHHIAVVIARGPSCPTRGVSVYLDGASLTPAPLPIQTGAGISLDNTDPFNIGASKPRFDGDMDEVMVFQRALTPTEVAAISDPGGFLVSCPARGSTTCTAAVSPPPCFHLISQPGPLGTPTIERELAGSSELTSEFGLRAVTPNPTQRIMHVNFTLADSRPAKIEVFSVTGQRVASREVGTFGPGTHTITVGERATLPSGVYLVRLTQGARSQTARIVLVR